MSGEIVPAPDAGDHDRRSWGKGDLKRLLLARSYGASDETIAREFGWTIEELHSLLGVELP